VTTVAVLLVRLARPVHHTQIVGGSTAKILDVVDVLPAMTERREAKAVHLRWSVNHRECVLRRQCVARCEYASGTWKGLVSMFGIGMEDIFYRLSN
jgi:hypothetical protein